MKNKNLANKILLMVFVLFLVAIGLKYYYKDKVIVEMFFSIMEAALVGGIADWFAITALFKKPLGFPWHTALIPRHREKVIKSIRNMIDQDLLTAESIKRRVDNSCFVSLLIGFVENKRGKELLRGSLERLWTDVLKNLDIGDVVRHLDGFIRREIKNISLVSQTKNAIRWLLENQRAQVLTTHIIDELINQLGKAETKQIIHKYLEDLTQTKSRSPLEKAFIWLGEQTNSISLSDATDAFYGELIIILQEVKNPEHILHTRIYEKLSELLEEPEMDFIWLEQMENWKMKLATDAELSDKAVHMFENFVETTNPQLYSQLINWIYRQIDRYWEFFKESSEIQEWLEIRIKLVMHQFIEKEHYIIGEMVERVLSEFTNDKLNGFVEDKAGDDLQWIRINGSVVGGIVGFIMFLFLHYFYDPYVIPMIQGWL